MAESTLTHVERELDILSVRYQDGQHSLCEPRGGGSCNVRYDHPATQPILLYWQGQGHLWQVFWLYGVATSLALAAVFAIAVVQDVNWLQFVMMAVFACYTAWIVVSVWRCAPNVSDQRLIPIARGLTIAWALNTIFVLAFLIIDVLVTPVLAG